MRHCPNCKQNVRPTKRFNWTFFLLTAIFGIGIIYLIWYILKGSKDCPICGSHTLKG